jgi:hypothetical protein
VLARLADDPVAEQEVERRRAGRRGASGEQRPPEILGRINQTARERSAMPFETT